MLMHYVSWNTLTNCTVLLWGNGWKWTVLLYKSFFKVSKVLFHISMYIHIFLNDIYININVKTFCYKVFFLVAQLTEKPPPLKLYWTVKWLVAFFLKEKKVLSCSVKQRAHHHKRCNSLLSAPNMHTNSCQLQFKRHIGNPVGFFWNVLDDLWRK